MWTGRWPAMCAVPGQVISPLTPILDLPQQEATGMGEGLLRAHPQFRGGVRPLDPLL